MSMKDLVSVIVPVYNVEQYLDKCIDSIVHQSYKKLEIILIDDGSKDSSGQLCEKWKQMDNRIKVIHKQNEGLGFARNTGIDAAIGDYVLYIDSDDYIDVNMIDILIKKSKETNSDTVYCGLTRVSADETETPVSLVYDNKLFTGREIITNILLEMVGSKPQDKEDTNFFMSVWHAIYSMDIIRKHNIRFPSERQVMCEDIMYHINYLRYTERVSCIKDCLYYYRVNPKSLSQIYDAKRFERQKVLSRAIIDALDEFVDPTDYLIREQRRLLGGARMQIQAIAASKEQNKIELIDRICSDEYIEEILKYYPYKKNPIKHKVFNYCMKNRKNLMLLVLCKLFAIIRQN